VNYAVVYHGINFVDSAIGMTGVEVGEEILDARSGLAVSFRKREGS